MHVKLLVTTIIASILLLDFFPKSVSSPGNAIPEKYTAENKTADSIAHFTISAVGDLMCHSTQYKYVLQNDGTYDFAPCFEFISPYLQSADLTIGNVETTFGGKSIPYSGFPLFNSPDDYAKGLQQAGFDFVTTGNNHSNDTYTNGIYRTIDVLDSMGLKHTGTFKTEKERNTIELIQVANTSIAILNYSYSTNGIDLPVDKPYLVNIIDSALIVNDIRAAKNLDAELIIIYYHFGEEYQRSPSPYQEKYAAIAINAGADIILGSHPHVLQPADFFATQGGNIDTGFIIYSMGNFISNQRDPHTYEGIIVNLHFDKNMSNGKIRLAAADYIPTWVYRGTNAEKKLHVVFPALDTAGLPADYLHSSDKQEIINAGINTAKLMTTYTDKFKPASLK